MNTTAIIVLAVIALAAVAYAKSRKKNKVGKPDASPPAPAPVRPPVAPTPTPIRPPVATTPPNPVPPVIRDRNGRAPGDVGYDPRASRPDPEFSPIEPRGTFYGEGAFDPESRWIDQSGRLHNP